MKCNKKAQTKETKEETETTFMEKLPSSENNAKKKR
jgi:hypothetical protein